MSKLLTTLLFVLFFCCVLPPKCHSKAIYGRAASQVIDAYLSGNLSFRARNQITHVKKITLSELWSKGHTRESSILTFEGKYGYKYKYRKNKNF